MELVIELCIVTLLVFLVFLVFIVLFYYIFQSNEVIFFTTIFIILLLASVGISMSWKASKYETKLINESYNKKYTTADLFWNGTLIKQQLMIDDHIVTDSKNININLKEK